MCLLWVHRTWWLMDIYRSLNFTKLGVTNSDIQHVDVTTLSWVVPRCPAVTPVSSGPHPPPVTRPRPIHPPRFCRSRNSRGLLVFCSSSLLPSWTVTDHCQSSSRILRVFHFPLMSLAPRRSACRLRYRRLLFFTFFNNCFDFLWFYNESPVLIKYRTKMSYR